MARSSHQRRFGGVLALCVPLGWGVGSCSGTSWSFPTISHFQRRSFHSCWVDQLYRTFTVSSAPPSFISHKGTNGHICLLGIGSNGMCQKHIMGMCYVSYVQRTANALLG